MIFCLENKLKHAIFGVLSIGYFRSDSKRKEKLTDGRYPGEISLLEEKWCGWRYNDPVPEVLNSEMRINCCAL